MEQKPLLQWVENRKKIRADPSNFFGHKETMDGVVLYHRGFSQYEKTPLVELSSLAQKLGVEKIWVKDESKRFGLNAFKVLGGSYAMKQILESSPKGAKQIFVTATDGNHGRGVAWAAKTLGHEAVVFLPQGTAATRLENIRKEGAEAEILPMGYDDVVRHAAAYADEVGGILIQDTAWEGYETIPKWIMEGYYTIMAEILDVMIDSPKPTHVFLQAGVGSFPASMTACLAAVYGEEMPRVIIMEPHHAACIYASVRADTGKPMKAEGDLDTIMAGLACGEPSSLSWKILRDHVFGALSCDDTLSALGMRILGNPLTGDDPVVSGESGAIGAGVLYALHQDPSLAPIKEALGLKDSSRVLLISTEGDTDPVNYRKVVWEGAYPYEPERGFSEEKIK
ncbi:diaminopropionate ammonia-lyase [Alkalibacter rhizosphaerae]|uniref:Diaminopropionate ammonia-lyase n=1 Tax=Alkalibacter rhizosphaerae TaxID=2815577 RepID=A0A974XDY7_9FIRM|nr:diaminopropionate ammonia-lyase [Alkalibacter rhizosphaerae]QSX08087.1 diaminopropionate ammonia-lyase [Alkalibacter rhizosphaerae]